MIFEQAESGLLAAVCGGLHLHPPLLIKHWEGDRVKSQILLSGMKEKQNHFQLKGNVTRNWKILAIIDAFIGI